MINLKRRMVLKSVSVMAAALPVVGLSALNMSAQSSKDVTAMGSDVVKREFTLTNLTPNYLTLDKNTPIDVPAYSNSSKVKFDMTKARGATLAPGDNITFDVIVAKDSMLDVNIDEVVIKSDQSDYEHIVSAMNFTAQVSII